MRNVALVAALLAWVVMPATAQEAPERAEPDRFLEECGGEQESEEGHGETETEGESRFSDQCQPLEDLPDRPKALIELGTAFLGTGPIGDGFTLPTGAVWQPSFLAFGTLRTAVQGGTLAGFDDPLVEAVARFDLFGNLYLTQTERIVVGIRPLQQDGRFTGLTISSPAGPDDEEFRDELNADITTLFFEGDLAEVFPNLDKDDSGGDLYLSVGRQALGFQDGMLVNEDVLDMVGLTKANLKFGSAINTRIAAIFAWGEANRAGVGPTGLNPKADGTRMFGLFSEIDLRSTTLNIDAAFVQGGDLDDGTPSGDGLYAGVSDIRRIGHYNNTFRVLASFPMGDETFANQQGFLVHNQFGWTPYHSHDFWYVNTFAGIGSYRSALRGPSAGGPLGQTGILFAAPGIGRIGAALGGQADDAVGAAVGKQMFFDHTRKQLVAEIGGRYRYSDPEEETLVAQQDIVGGALRFQAAAGRRFVFVIDAIGRYDLGVSDLADSDPFEIFGRVELLLKL